MRKLVVLCLIWLLPLILFGQTAPLVDNPIDDQVFDEGFSSFVIDLDTVFSDPDISDILSFSAISSNTAAVTVDVATNILTISEAGLGTSTITVTATDNGVGNLTVDDVFTVTVNNVNDFPLVDNPIADQIYDEGFGSDIIDLATVFSDPDGDNLSLSVVSSNTGVVNVGIVGTILTITEVGLGSATVTVTATDDGVPILAVDDPFLVTVNNVNDNPLVDNPIADQIYDEGFGSDIIDLATVFSDPDGDNLSLSVVSSNTGVVNVGIVGTILTITEVGLGSATVTVTATDDGVPILAVDDPFLVTVNNVNDNPLVDNPIADQIYDEGFGSDIIDLATVFSDPDGDNLSLSVVSSNTGVVNVGIVGTILTITEVGLGSATVTVTATDDGVPILAVDDPFLVTVNNVNDNPLVDNPIADQIYDEGFGSDIIDLATVFSDPDGDNLSLSVVSSNTGVVNVGIVGTILTITEVGLGSATVTVTATDDGVPILAVDDPFLVTVNNVNDNPLVDNPIADQIYDEGFGSDIIDLATVFSDPDGDNLSLSVVSSNTGVVNVGIVGTILTITEVGLGSATVTVTATDDGVPILAVDDPFLVTVNNVNDNPLVDNPIADQIYDEGFGSDIIDLATVFSDPDGDNLSLSVVSSNTGVVNVGIVGTILTITEVGLGSATVTVTATDDGVPILAVDDPFLVTVNNVNDNPLVDNPIADQIYDEGFGSDIIDLATVFSDPDGDNLSLSVVSSNTGVVNVGIVGTILTITEVGLGSATVTVTATDDGVPILAVDDPFLVTVNNVNDNPLVDNPIADQIYDEGFGSDIIDLATVFSDPDGDNLSLSVVSSNTGVVNVGIVGTILTITEVGLGSATVTVTATDDGVPILAVDDPFLVTVNNVNDNPLVDNPIADQIYDEGFGSDIIDLATVFSDPDGDNLSLSVVSSNTGVVNVGIVGTILTITEVGLGSATVTVTATDDGVPILAVDDPFLVTVNNVNDNPLVDNPIADQIYDEGFGSDIIDLATVFSDPDGDNLSLSVVSSNTGVVNVGIVGTILTITEVGLGSATVTVTATDDGVPILAVDDPFLVTVNNVNDNPLVDNPIADQIYDEGFGSDIIDLATVFSDPDGDNLSLSVVSSNTGVVNVGIVGTILTITEVGLGSATVTVTATDDGVPILAVDDPFLVTVNNVNDNPLVDNPIADQIYDEGFGSDIIDLATVFSDPDGDNLSLSVVSSNTGVVNVGIVGTILTITEVGLGSATVTVTATDDGVPILAVDDPFLVTVNNVNDNPLVDNPIADQIYDEGFGSDIIDLATVFSDPDGDNLSLSVVSSNTGVVNVGIVGTILTITEVGLGSATVTVTATDDGVPILAVDDPFLVTVNNVNDNPLVDNPIADQIYDEGFGSDIIDLATVFSDPDGDNLSLSVVSSNTGVVNVGIVGTILTITEVGLGSATVTVTATDDGVGNLTVDDVFTVTVNNAFYDINISANPSEGGSISGGGTYSIGATVNLLATPSSGYNFVDWTDDSDNSYVSDLADYSFSAIEDISLTANFEANQSITLSTGWNIMSSNIIPDDPSMPNVLSSLIISGFLEKVQDETGDAVEYVEPIGWVYNIAEIAPTEGYKIRVNTDTQLDISGSYVASPLTIDLLSGWNIMGFPDRTSQPAMDIVNDLITASQLNKVQNESGQAIEFISGIGWVNNIINFSPGEGYKINVSVASSINYDGLPKSYQKSGHNSYYVHFKPAWYGNGHDHMNVYILTGDGFEPGDEIALYDGDVCVGIGSFEANTSYVSIAASLDDPLTSWQDGFVNGNNIELKVWDESEDIEYIVKEIQFYDQNMVSYSSLESTVIEMNLLDIIKENGFSDKSNELGNAYPNPFNYQTVIPYLITKTSVVRIEIFDISGKKMKVLLDQEIIPGEKTIIWDGTDHANKQVPSGLYYYKLISGDYTEVKTIVFFND